MSKYRITITEGKQKHESFIIESTSYELAAQIALSKIGVHGKNTQAIRVSGIANKSGIFQAYRQVSKKNHGREINSVGPNFHVSEVR